MPRAVDPPGRSPGADRDPASRNILFDPLTMPGIDWLKIIRGWIHGIVNWGVGVISTLSGGLIDLSGLHEMLDEMLDEFGTSFGTGQNIMKLIRFIIRTISEATGLDLTAIFVDLLPKLIDLLQQLAEIGTATGQTLYEIVMLPINILRQLQKVFSGEAVDWSLIPELFQPIVAAFTNWWSVVGSALPGAIDAAQQALWYIAELLWRLGQQTVAGLADKLNGVLRQIISPLNWNLWGQIRGARVPATHVAEPNPELLDNPDFIDPISIASQELWMHDGLAVLPGAARVDADGTRKTLVSNPIQVSNGMQINLEVLINHQGVAATANQNAIRMSIHRYDWQANRLGEPVFIAGIASPAGNGTDRKISGSYTAGPYTTGGAQLEDAWIAVRLDVTQHATAGTVWFHHASAKAFYPTPQIGFDSVRGIAGIFDIGSTMQTLWDQMQTAMKIDIPGLVTGASLSDVAQSLHELARNVGLNIQILRTTRTELGLPPVTPENAQVASPGTHVLTLPLEWDYVDAVALGGGGGGGALLGMIAGTGGWYGQFRAITLIRANRGLAVPPGATDYAYIHENATTVTMFVGAGGDGGSGLIGGVGISGQNSTISWNLPDGTARTVTALGGEWGGTSTFTNPNNPNPYRDSGKGPGTLFYRGKQYIGGGNVDRANGNVPGSPPGGGGGPGILRIIPDFGTWGGPGAHGSCWMRAYVAAELEVSA